MLFNGSEHKCKQFIEWKTIQMLLFLTVFWHVWLFFLVTMEICFFPATLVDKTLESAIHARFSEDYDRRISYSPSLNVAVQNDCLLRMRMCTVNLQRDFSSRSFSESCGSQSIEHKDTVSYPGIPAGRERWKRDRSYLKSDMYSLVVQSDSVHATAALLLSNVWLQLRGNWHLNWGGLPSIYTYEQEKYRR